MLFLSDYYHIFICFITDLHNIHVIKLKAGVIFLNIKSAYDDVDLYMIFLMQKEDMKSFVSNYESWLFKLECLQKCASYKTTFKNTIIVFLLLRNSQQ